MTDLTKITEPFGLLDKATQDALKAANAAGEIMEYYSVEGWLQNISPMWFSTYVYRVKPEPVRVVLVTSRYRDTKYIGEHVITSNEDGTDPTVTWEPSE